jgi:glucosamine--fructose-6-phosphate aminotransferase (isomerizing)
MTDEFRQYASAVIQCPTVGEGLDFIPQVMAGHLFGFYAARALDALATPLRLLRTRIVDALDDNRLPELSEAEEIEKELLLSGRGAAALEPGTSTRLLMALQYAQGELPLRNYRRYFGHECTTSAILENCVNLLTEAINQLTRPVDAIKHQAKTVTVGITREELKVPKLIVPTLHKLNIRENQLSRYNIALLTAVTPLLSKVEGATLYEITNLSDRGLPLENSVCRRINSTGIAKDIPSRTDTDPGLKGTKWLCIKERSLFIGQGGKDGRSIAVIPLAPSSADDMTRAELLLLHVSFKEAPAAKELATALKQYKHQYDRIVAAATERDIQWNDSLLKKTSVIQLFDETLSGIVKTFETLS